MAAKRAKLPGLIPLAVITSLTIGCIIGATTGALTAHATFSFYIRHSRWRDIVGK